jgi:hypothetical protein
LRLLKKQNGEAFQKEMLPIDKCIKILNSNGEKYSKGEVERIRDFLESFAKIEISIISKNKL